MPKDVPSFVQTEDRAFVRDTTNRALLNTDTAALTRHRLTRERQSSNTARLQSLEAEVAELKALVTRLLSK